MNKQIKFFITFAAVVLLTANCAFGADKSAPQYPPYPDVWGYDLYDEDAVESVSNQLYPYARENGDIAFTYSSEFQEDNAEPYYKRTLLSFFRQTKDLIPSQIKEGVAKKYNLTNFDKLRDYVVYENENTVVETRCYKDYKIYADDRVRYCVLQKGIAKPNTNGAVIDTSKPIEKYSVLGVELDENGDADIYPTVYQLIELRDGTYIGYYIHGQWVIRFDKNLKTKFKSERIVKLKDGKELKGALFILPYSKVEYFYDHVVKNYNGEFTQDIANQFADYLYNEQQKGNLN